MVVTNDRKLAEKIKIIRNHGRGSYGPAEIIELGFNYRMSEINAVLGLSQLAHVTEYVENRNKFAKIYNEKLSKIKWLSMQKIREGNLSSYYAYNVKLENDAPLTRDELILKLREKGVETSIMYRPVHLQPYYSKLFGFTRGYLPVAELLGERTLTLPLYSCMSVDDIEYVVETLKQVFQEA
jgi:perosamine synthetase